jgi:glycosyltransferase involved in cell wall biosynthesis
VISSRPSVSVILPTRNRAKVLRESLDSVLHQTWDDLELIIVDDASEDDTADLVGSIYDPRLRYHRRRSRGGGAAARNDGAALARANLLAFQDSDDLWAPEKLRLQMVAMMTRPEDVGLHYCGLRREVNGRPLEIPRQDEFIEGRVYERLLSGNVIGTPCVLVRRHAFEFVGGFDARLGRLQDWELWLRLAVHYDFACLRDYLVNARRSEDSISNDDSAFVDALCFVVERHASALRSRPEILKAHLVWIAEEAYRCSRRRDALVACSRSLVLRPTVRDLSLGLRLILGERIHGWLRAVWRRAALRWRRLGRSGSV